MRNASRVAYARTLNSRRAFANRHFQGQAWIRFFYVRVLAPSRCPPPGFHPRRTTPAKPSRSSLAFLSRSYTPSRQSDATRTVSQTEAKENSDMSAATSRILSFYSHELM